MKKQCDATVAYEIETFLSFNVKTACHYTVLQSNQYKCNTIKCQDVSHSFVCEHSFPEKSFYIIKVKDIAEVYKGVISVRVTTERSWVRKSSTWLTYLILTSSLKLNQS